MGNNVDADIEALKTHIIALSEELKKKKEEEATFSYTEADKALYKSYKSATTMAMVHTAIEKWFSVYSLEVAGSDLINEIVSAISGEAPATNKEVINSGATKFNGKRRQGDFLKVFYGKLAEKMLEAGTLKATAIPEEVREYYAPKKKEGKKSKKNKGVK